MPCLSGCLIMERYLIERYLYVGLGGGFGALCRYALLGLNENEPGVFPYSTILVNLVGAFLLTFLLNLTIFDLKINREIQLAIIVGTIGSFTTFSLIMTDMISLLDTPWLFILYYIRIKSSLFKIFNSIFGIFLYIKRSSNYSIENIFLMIRAFVEFLILYTQFL